MPQDVALTHAPPLRRQDMTEGNIFDVDNIQAGVDVCRDFAAQEIHDDLAARSRLHIPGSHREAGVDDDHGDATLGVRQHFLLGEVFRAFVVAYHVPWLQKDILGAWCTILW